MQEQNTFTDNSKTFKLLPNKVTFSRETMGIARVTIGFTKPHNYTEPRFQDKFGSRFRSGLALDRGSL
jgi:hypothetical protein